jgi:hypothetical protein
MTATGAHLEEEEEENGEPASQPGLPGRARAKAQNMPRCSGCWIRLSSSPILWTKIEIEIELGSSISISN